MKIKNWLTFASLFLLVFILVGCKVNNNFYQVEKKLTDYNVIFTVKNNPPIQGNNQVEIKILDSKNSPIKDAQIQNLEYIMPAMPGMPPMKYQVQSELSGDIYKTTLDFSMSGSWTIKLAIKKGTKIEIVEFNVDVK